MTSSWIVHKFGGTSVADAAAIRNAVQLAFADEASAGTCVVVSAMARVTDELLALVALAARGDKGWMARLEALVVRHEDAAAQLLEGKEREAYARFLAERALEVDAALRPLALLKNAPAPLRDLIAGHGELWNAPLVAAASRAAGFDAVALDAREVLFVAPGETGPAVDWERSGAALTAWLARQHVSRVIASGFVAANPDGNPTTLGRNGSDFSAAIFGALLRAQSVVIWTDVDGVLTADPRLVPEAIVIDEMSYDEAMELAYFGATVLHPHTMEPCVRQGIPLWIRNSRNPAARGTRIAARDTLSPTGPDGAVRGFSTVSALSLLDVEGSGMIGVPGVARRLFGALHSVGVSVVMISQASSEHSICVAVPEAQAALAQQTLEEAFFGELRHGQIQRVLRTDGCTILAAVGDSMAQTPGVASRFFAALGNAGINVRAIAQGSSERNITAVIASADAARALRVVHAGFYLSAQTLSLGLVGPGHVGAAFLAQLAAQRQTLREHFNIDLRLRGIARGARMRLDSRPIDPGAWAAALEAGSVPTDLDAFAAHIQTDDLPHAVIVDCTASAEVAARYAGWLGRGIHVVTPNKKANSGAWADYRALRDAERTHGSRYYYEATVGAGLPIITTLRDIIRTGDRVRRIEGVLSGTLSYLFNVYDGTTPFSQLVAEACARGWTEPDPRDDLSGMDVARKLIILAREAEVNLELPDVVVENLVPEPLRALVPVDEFLHGLVGHDAAMRDRFEAARAAGCVLRYVGSVDPLARAAHVRLERYPRDHAFAGLSATDNLVAFTTDRYAAQPLIVRGPGAGPEVTASGVFADLLRLASSLGGRVRP